MARPKNICLTGGTGFVGQHILRHLAPLEVKITIPSRTKTGKHPEFDNVVYVSYDISLINDNTYETLGKPDTLFDLAWEGLPNYRSKHHLEVELPKHLAFIEHMLSCGVNNLFVAGTCFEYGMIEGELSEQTPTKADNYYGQAKDQLRKNIEQLKDTYDFNLTWARFFYIFGDGQSRNSIKQQLEKAISEHQKTFPMSGGQQQRDFIDIREASKMVVDLVMSGKDNGVVNICSGKPITVEQQVINWLAEMGQKIELELGVYPYPDYEPMRFWGSNKKLQKLLSEV